MSIDLKIKKIKLEQATEHGNKYLPLNLKAKKIREKLTAKRFKKYAANLRELDPAKLWHGSRYLVAAHIKTDCYGQFCMAYGIGRWGDPSTDGSRRLELPHKHRQAFAADPRVSLVKCTDGSGDSVQALTKHLQFKQI